MSGLDSLLEKYIDIVFSEKENIKKKDYFSKACGSFRVDKDLASQLLKYLEEEGYVERSKYEITKKRGFTGKAKQTSKKKIKGNDSASSSK